MQITYPFINDEHLYAQYYKQYINVDMDVPNYDYVEKKIRFENNLMRNMSEMCFKDFREKLLIIKSESPNATIDLSEVIKLDIVRYHLFENSLMNLYSILEEYLSKLCIYIETKNGKISNTLKKSLLHNSFITNVRYLDDNYTLNLEETINKIKGFGLLKARRHCLTHELGFINLLNYSKLECDKEKIGGKIIIDDAIYGQSSVLITLIARVIYLTIKEHFNY